MKHLCVGMFGTCDKSTFRKDLFIPRYKAENIHYFNPQLGEGEWNEECAEIEAQHLKTDRIILFPILSESYGLGSLAETGFSVMQAINTLRDDRYLITMIDDDVDYHLKPKEIDENDEEAKKENARKEALAVQSKKARALAKAHLQQYVNHPHVFVVDSLDTMLELSVRLYRSIEQMGEIRDRYVTRNFA